MALTVETRSCTQRNVFVNFILLLVVVVVVVVARIVWEKDMDAVTGIALLNAKQVDSQAAGATTIRTVG
jgi:type IV secretory pathway VirB3-like protein